MAQRNTVRTLVVGVVMVFVAVIVQGEKSSAIDTSSRTRVEREAHCGRSVHHPDTGPTGGQQEVTVLVPRTALLRVDWTGRVRAASTNTGCAPRDGDDVYLIHPNGSVTKATAVDLDDIRWHGDFSVAGRFQMQPLSGGASAR